MTEGFNSDQQERLAHYFSPTSLDSMRRAGCKLVNQYLPEYDVRADATETFGVTKDQFDRAYELEWIRRGRPENAVVQALYSENERLRGELARIGLFIDAAVHGNKRADEPANLTARLDMVRKIASQLAQLVQKGDSEESEILG